ncbi:glycerol-3-phosphate acyltransferase [Advenella faeciporci]|uniref:Glycerol-3-phosphate acyltransferase n=1 Tax=Advenella faeciporci TaxID=797535 RepID=A0A918JGL1_9BURK|nr:glycerol-3-phosphate 1-O-acyltransferase PlsY [Advenella faeciporci]GGW75050.1 glycerol-3-phosphate acyltransferase [Advenella faeciporci]
MNTILAGILAIILAYLAGSVPFAIITSKLFGLKDPRTFGSGNPGATNVLRTGNKLAAALTLAGDAFKGWLAVYLAIKFAPELNLTVTGIALVALAVFLGHLYSVFLKFKGGKGVATAIGILLAIQPWLAMATLATWIIIAVFFRYSSLAAIIAAIFAPFYYYAGDQIAWHKLPEIFWVICLISIMLIYKHKKNIANLLAGTETRLGQKNKHRH